jgi:hypothetical protein
MHDVRSRSTQGSANSVQHTNFDEAHCHLPLTNGNVFQIQFLEAMILARIVLGGPAW